MVKNAKIGKPSRRKNVKIFKKQKQENDQNLKIVKTQKWSDSKMKNGQNAKM